MLKVVRVKDNNGSEYSVFTGCTETGYTARDIINMPGAYDECTSANSDCSMSLYQINGSINNYHTKCFALVLDEKYSNIQDLTGDVSRVLMMPSTAANILIQSMPEDTREDIKEAVESLHFYEEIREDSKVCLPTEAMSHLDEAVANKMSSAKQTFLLRSTENQEIFQKSYDSEFGVRLPTLDDIHSYSGFKFNPMDIVRATMPYRRVGNPSTYEPIYHTPYYKVGSQMGFVPPYLDWIDGYSSNDLMDIQSNERHMQRNLYTLYQSDVSSYVDEMVTGVFLNTKLGSMLSRLWRLRERDAIDKMVDDIKNYCEVDGTPSAKCSITLSDVESLWNNGWQPSEVCNLLKDRLSFDEGYFFKIIKELHPARRIVTTKNLIFVLNFSTDDEKKFIDLFLEKGFVTHEFHSFLLRLCQAAYEANWGHTGSAVAIPCLVDQADMDNIGKEFNSFLNAREAGRAPSIGDCIKLYKGTYSDPTTLDNSDFDSMSISDSDSEDVVSIAFNRYVTKTTAARITSGELDINNLFSVKENESVEDRKARLNATLDSDSRKIERWLIVDGNQNLVYFLTAAYMQTADIKIFIQAFIKLVRWGNRRPKTLTIQDHPEIRTVFDLCLGCECDNVAIVDEKDLVKVNGCDYSLAGFLSSNSNNDINSSHIIGFILEKNYGSIVKQYLASWEDIAEMEESGNINIGEFKVGSAIYADAKSFIPIESFEKKLYEVYESDKCVNEGLKLKVRGKELSCITLLTKPHIMNERSYIRSGMNSVIVTLQDRQYDILRRYTDNVKRFYSRCGDALKSMKTTRDLQTLALQFGEIVKAGATSKKEQNESVASNTMGKLELDFGSSSKSSGSIEYRTDELKGKFVLVVDTDNSSIKDDTWEPIKFTHPQLQKIASRPNTSIVLLLMKASDCWLVCRKDIRPDEVDVVRKPEGPKINSQHYARIRKQLLELLNGGSSNYDGLPIRLHESAKLPR